MLFHIGNNNNIGEVPFIAKILVCKEHQYILISEKRGITRGKMKSVQKDSKEKYEWFNLGFVDFLSSQKYFSLWKASFETREKWIK